MVVVVVEMKNYTAAVHQGVHMLEALVSKRGYVTPHFFGGHFFFFTRV